MGRSGPSRSCARASRFDLSSRSLRNLAQLHSLSLTHTLSLIHTLALLHTHAHSSTHTHTHTLSHKHTPAGGAKWLGGASRGRPVPCGGRRKTRNLGGGRLGTSILWQDHLGTGPLPHPRWPLRSHAAGFRTVTSCVHMHVYTHTHTHTHT